MKRTTACGLATLLLGITPQAMAGLAKDSPLRLTDCVPYDDASLERLRALRDKVRAEFARHGGAGTADHWTREWNPAWLLADDWSPVIGDDGMIGLDSPSKNMAALIPEAWARPATGTKASVYGRTCRVAYLERETWKDPETGKLSFQAEAVLGCAPVWPSQVGEDLLVVLRTAEYETS